MRKQYKFRRQRPKSYCLIGYEIDFMVPVGTNSSLFSVLPNKSNLNNFANFTTSICSLSETC